MKRSGKAVIWMILLGAGFACCLAVAQTDTEGRDGSFLVDTVSVQSAGPVNSPEPGTTARQGSMISRYAERNLLRFDKSPLFITILYVVILYSIITLITLLIIILLIRGRLQREEKKREYLKGAYQLKLMDYLFQKGKQEQARKGLEEIASNRFNRQILINQMVDLGINLKGDIKEVIKELYLQMGLERDSLEKAYSRKWHENVKGFRELAFMNIRDANERILECVNSGNEILRMEAQIALVRLSDDNPYHFLHYLEKPLSRWEQITLHELLIHHELKVPEFKQWFESENITVVIFALKMVSFFGQKGSGREVVRLFSHEDEEVRNTAFKVSGDIGLKSALPELEKRYYQETYRNKLTILDTFVRVPEEKYLQFLKSVLDAEDDVQLQILATKAIENTDEPGVSMLIKLMKSKSGYKNYQIIIRHVLDGRIY